MLVINSSPEGAFLGYAEPWKATRSIIIIYRDIVGRVRRSVLYFTLVSCYWPRRKKKKEHSWLRNKSNDAADD